MVLIPFRKNTQMSKAPLCRTMSLVPERPGKDQRGGEAGRKRRKAARPRRKRAASGGERAELPRSLGWPFKKVAVLPLATPVTRHRQATH